MSQQAIAVTLPSGAGGPYPSNSTTTGPKVSRPSGKLTTVGITRRHRKDGTPFYEAQVNRPMINGKRQSPLSKSFATEAQAIDWRAETLATQTAVALSGAATLAEWAASWIPTATHLAPATRRSYETLLRLHVLPRIGTSRLVDIRPSQLSVIYTDILTRRSHGTMTRVHAATLQLLKAALSEGLIDVNPAAGLKLPKATLADFRDIHAWDVPTVTSFLQSTHVVHHQLSPLLTVAFHTGARRGELLGLTPADVTVTGTKPAITIRRSVTLDEKGNRITTVTKSRNGNRRIPLTPQALQAVKQAMTHRAAFTAPDPELFLDSGGHHLSGDTVTKAFGHLVHSFTHNTAIPRLTLHGARHSFVTNLLTQGTPIATVSKLAGHASVSFTIDRYGHLLDSYADDALQGLYAPSPVPVTT